MQMGLFWVTVVWKAASGRQLCTLLSTSAPPSYPILLSSFGLFLWGKKRLCSALTTTTTTKKTTKRKPFMPYTPQALVVTKPYISIACPYLRRLVLSSQYSDLLTVL